MWSDRHVLGGVDVARGEPRAPHRVPGPGHQRGQVQRGLPGRGRGRRICRVSIYC